MKKANKTGHNKDEKKEEESIILAYKERDWLGQICLPMDKKHSCQ